MRGAEGAGNTHSVESWLLRPSGAGALRGRLSSPHLPQVSVHLLLLQLASLRSPLCLFCQELKFLFFLLQVFKELLHARCFYDIQLLPSDRVLSHSVFQLPQQLSLQQGRAKARKKAVSSRQLRLADIAAISAW